MHTRESARGTVAHARPGDVGLLAGIGHTALVVGSALAASLLLIVMVGVVSVCWEIHPMLTVVAVLFIGWLLTRLAGLVLCTGRRAAD